MSNDSDDQSFHSPGPHSERPAGHDVPTLVAGERRQRSESHGTHNLAPRALTDLTLVEGATAGSDRQTRSKEQAVPVCLGPLDKPIFDERFAVPRARDCFMAVKFRAKLPDSCIQDTWEVEKGTISLADNSSQTILEQLRVIFKLAESTVYYDFSVLDSLCHEVVIGRNLLTVLRSVVSLPGGGIEVFCGNPIVSM